MLRIHFYFSPELIFILLHFFSASARLLCRCPVIAKLSVRHTDFDDPVKIVQARITKSLLSALWLLWYSSFRFKFVVNLLRVWSVLDPFPTVLEATVHHPAVGSSLSLYCSVPACYPPGNVYWGENRNGPKLRLVETTERISLDYDGKRASV